MSRKPPKAETASQLETMSAAQLADAYGPLAVALKPLEKRAELFKKEFERRGVTLLIGEKFSVQKSEVAFDGVDIAAARAALGAAWCDAHKKPVKRVSWKANELNEVDKAAASGAEGEGAEAA